MMDAAHRYGGHVVQSTGDGVFALFGAPIAHEDHPQRALYAALRMQEEMRRYADRLRAEGRAPLQVRVGVNTGEVVVRSIQTGEHAEYTPIGHSTGMAARMQVLAPIGSIAVTEATERLCAGYFAFRLLGPARVKGASEPINVYEVTGLGPLRTRLEAAARRGLTRFVGREHELAQMRRALELVRAGHGQVVAAIGDAGVGKSRLTYEFKAVAAGDCLLLEAYSVSHGKASAYLPVIEMLHGYFGIDSADDGRKRREKVIGKLLALDQSLEDALPYLFVLLGIQEGEDPFAQMDVQTRRRRTQEALKRIVLRESLNQPLIVVFEDLHWVDGETQAWLNLLADSLANARVLLLVNYRPEYRHEWGNRTYYTQLRLDPLAGESVEQLLSALLGDSAGLAALRRMIAERTEGNPFFIEEMVQALFDDGTLARNGAVRLTRALAEIKVPATVQGIVASRIDRLPADEKELLQTLAVIGREFPRGLITRIVRKSDSELDRMLIRSSACRVHLRATGSSRSRVHLQACAHTGGGLQDAVARAPQAASRIRGGGDRSALPRTARRSPERSGASLRPERKRAQGCEIPSPGRATSRRAHGLRRSNWPLHEPRSNCSAPCPIIRSATVRNWHCGLTWARI